MSQRDEASPPKAASWFRLLTNRALFCLRRGAFSSQKKMLCSNARVLSAFSFFCGFREHKLNRSVVGKGRDEHPRESNSTCEGFMLGPCLTCKLGCLD